MIRNSELAGMGRKKSEAAEAKSGLPQENGKIEKFFADAALTGPQVDKELLGKYDLEIIKKIAEETITEEDLADYGNDLREKLLDERRHLREKKGEQPSEALRARKNIFPFIYRSGMAAVENKKYKQKRK